MAINPNLPIYEAEATTTSPLSSEDEGSSCIDEAHDAIQTSSSSRMTRGRSSPYPTRPIVDTRNLHFRSAADKEKALLRRLYLELASLSSILPASERPQHPCCVITRAIKYKRVLKKQIRQLLALPYDAQVDVRMMQNGSLHIKVSCKKKAGLLVALMEVMEGFKLFFENANVSCKDDDIAIDAHSSKDISCSAGSLRLALVTTIARFNSNKPVPWV